MCYAVGSLQQATGTCPMCKVFRPSGSRCPHIKETCRNTAVHPRHEVIYLKNAEVQTFNGCGYCKWARTNPPPRSAGYNNPGWPGCCRPPTPNEHRLIGAADWPSVSLVHHIPIPPDIKSILEAITSQTTRAGVHATNPTGTIRGQTTQASAPGIARRSSHSVSSPTRAEGGAPRANTVAIPGKSRSGGGSPQQIAATLTGTASRNAPGDGVASSLPNASSIEQAQAPRRTALEVFTEKRPDPSNTSPARKSAELVGSAGSVSRRSSERRPSVTAATPSMPVSKVAAERRRTGPNGSPPSQPIRAKSVERSERAAPATVSKRTAVPIEDAVAKLAVSSAASSSSGSSSGTTVISDGGFTDYLSDESEAELQRQAEVKAAILAQNQLEEMEFKAARQQLANVGLRPPKSWRGDLVDTVPRSQAQSQNRVSTTYSQAFSTPSYVPAPASTVSRG